MWESLAVSFVLLQLPRLLDEVENAKILEATNHLLLKSKEGTTGGFSGIFIFSRILFIAKTFFVIVESPPLMISNH